MLWCLSQRGTSRSCRYGCGSCRDRRRRKVNGQFVALQDKTYPVVFRYLESFAAAHCTSTPQSRLGPGRIIYPRDVVNVVTMGLGSGVCRWPCWLDQPCHSPPALAYAGMGLVPFAPEPSGPLSIRIMNVGIIGCRDHTAFISSSGLDRSQFWAKRIAPFLSDEYVVEVVTASHGNPAFPLSAAYYFRRKITGAGCLLAEQMNSNQRGRE